MNRITGRSAFLALLKDEGITHLFGNPGTTELPIMHALKDHPDLTYVMAMQESLVAAPRAGWSPATSMSRPGSATRWARCSTPVLRAPR
jgi:benzoylformate decarboxylase